MPSLSKPHAELVEAGGGRNESTGIGMSPTGRPRRPARVENPGQAGATTVRPIDPFATFEDRRGAGIRNAMN